MSNTPPPHTHCVLLIADDESVFRKFLGDRLEKEGLKTCYASNGAEAVAVARKEKPKLAILDLRMPVLDGFDACLKLKEDPQTHDIKVIFLTALAGDKERDAAVGLAYGAVDFIDKNVGLDPIIERIKKQLFGLSE